MSLSALTDTVGLHLDFLWVCKYKLYQATTYETSHGTSLQP